MSEHSGQSHLPIPVHVVADSTRDDGRPAVRGSYGTFLLTSADNAMEILPPASDPREAYVIGIDSAIVIAADRQAAAGGYGTTVPQGLRWPVRDQGAVWAGATLSGPAPHE